MGIRKKILLYFSLVSIILMGFAFVLIYTLFSQYREEEFQQRQKEKIKSTLYFLSEIKKADNTLTEAIDRLTIHDLYNEKLLIFNHKKKLIYASIDDTPIPYSEEILEQLSPENEWYESKEDLYDVVGLYFENGGNVYYGISKAYDTFGYSKLRYLRFILLTSFGFISVIIIVVSYFLANRIAKPLVVITKSISEYNVDVKKIETIADTTSKDEITILANQFQKLMQRINEVFAFQKHAIQHISHELKTPVSILVSNFERMENETDLQALKLMITQQKEDTKQLSEIINALLEIAKTETSHILKNDTFRADELIFDLIAELNVIYPSFLFSVQYLQTENENMLSITANKLLLKTAFMNLMLNCIQYSHIKTAEILIDGTAEYIEISFKNKGQVIQENEQKYLFQHFFRGQNSKGKRGFGLGLVLVNKIITLHNGTILYQSVDNEWNIFKVILPLK